MSPGQSSQLHVGGVFSDSSSLNHFGGRAWSCLVVVVRGQVSVTTRGEHVVSCLGELHLEQSLKVTPRSRWRLSVMSRSTASLGGVLCSTREGTLGGALASRRFGQGGGMLVSAAMPRSKLIRIGENNTSLFGTTLRG